MAMTDKDHDEAMLDAVFTAARNAAPEPSDALIARVLADAEALRVRPAPAPLPRAGRASVRARLGEVLGGWQGLGGLVTATAAGLWIGYAGIADPADLTGGLLGASETVELMPAADVFALVLETEG